MRRQAGRRLFAGGARGPPLALGRQQERGLGHRAGRGTISNRIEKSAGRRGRRAGAGQVGIGLGRDRRDRAVQADRRVGGRRTGLPGMERACGGPGLGRLVVEPDLVGLGASGRGRAGACRRARRPAGLDRHRRRGAAVGGGAASAEARATASRSGADARPGPTSTPHTEMRRVPRRIDLRRRRRGGERGLDRGRSAARGPRPCPGRRRRCGRRRRSRARRRDEPFPLDPALELSSGTGTSRRSGIRVVKSSRCSLSVAIVWMAMSIDRHPGQATGQSRRRQGDRGVEGLAHLLDRRPSDDRGDRTRRRPWSRRRRRRAVPCSTRARRPRGGWSSARRSASRPSRRRRR